ncbi:MAG: hypothetical protein JNL57_03850 [Bacteroidetes bacterium]|nr:hypothetical protein [Bacteroidota bacterium]
MSAVCLPVFPLPLVPLEDETLRLHIFESRYKKLIHHCLSTSSGFGLPAVLDGQVMFTGAELRITALRKEYASGEMDIECRVISRFNILEMYPASPPDYASALVQILPFEQDEEKEYRLRILDLMNELYRLAQTETVPELRDDYDLLEWVHKCGLSLQEELELAALQSFSERQLYLINHLKKTVATLQNVRSMNELIRKNGHFKKLSQSL